MPLQQQQWLHCFSFPLTSQPWLRNDTTMWRDVQLSYSLLHTSPGTTTSPKAVQSPTHWSPCRCLSTWHKWCVNGKINSRCIWRIRCICNTEGCKYLAKEDQNVFVWSSWRDGVLYLICITEYFVSLYIVQYLNYLHEKMIEGTFIYFIHFTAES